MKNRIVDAKRSGFHQLHHWRKTVFADVLVVLANILNRVRVRVRVFGRRYARTKYKIIIIRISIQWRIFCARAFGKTFQFQCFGAGNTRATLNFKNRFYFGGVRTCPKLNLCQFSGWFLLYFPFSFLNMFLGGEIVTVCENSHEKSREDISNGYMEKSKTKKFEKRVRFQVCTNI